MRTIFFGGGTPSLLDPGEIAALGRAIRTAFTLALEEVTVEANPATLDRARLDAWRGLGVTRLSLGAQTFADAGLRALGRTHQAADVAPAVAAARSVGLEVSLDLIFGWPGQTPTQLAADLDAAVALEPDHLSLYPLELELEPEAAVANWARPGRECRHNLAYWRNAEWLGVGAGAHSHLAGVRSHQPAALTAYLDRIERGQGRIADLGADPETDTAILALRLEDGLDLAGYADRFGPAAHARIAGALHALDGTGLLRWAGSRVALTERGRFVANQVFVRLLPDADRIRATASD